MDQIAEIRNKIDIVELIQEYLPLKKSGRNFKVVCPFHSEKTPSFIVSSERQIWHCFSCGKGGDCFTFLMEYEHMEFPEALRMLAEKTGVILVNQHIDTGLASKKEKLYSLNRLACEFYHYLLVKHTLGKNALNYVTEKRKIKPGTVNTFQIGFAPSGNALTTYLMKKKGYRPEDLLDGGFTIRKGSIYVDFFQNRLIFPLFDHRNNIIGFSGRVMLDSAKTSKYINTRETLVYHKGDTFFGMPQALEEMKKERKVYLMEGEFDVISTFQEGIVNCLAIKGTALTQMQVNLLARFVQKVVLCFDMDKPGQEALKRSLSFLEKKSLTIGVLELTNGKDPDEAIQKNSGEFLKAVKKDIPVYDFLLESLSGQYDINTIEGKMKIGKELLPVISGIENEIVKEHYLVKLGELLGTSQEALTREIEKNKKQEIASKIPNSPKLQRSRQEVLEEYLLAFLLQAENPTDLLSNVSPVLQNYIWVVPSFQKLFNFLIAFLKKNEKFEIRRLASSLPIEFTDSFDKCFLLPLPSINPQQLGEELNQVAKDLSTLSVKEQMRLIAEKIKKSEKTENVQDLEKLHQDFAVLLSRLSKK